MRSMNGTPISRFGDIINISMQDPAPSAGFILIAGILEVTVPSRRAWRDGGAAAKNKCWICRTSSRLDSAQPDCK